MIAISPEKYPPRYYERPDGHRGLITDESEWLARPNVWAIWQIGGERKINLYDHHWANRVSAFLDCERCKPLVTKIVSENGIVEIPEIPPGTTQEYRSWYQSSHGETACECCHIIRYIGLLKSNVITHDECRNKVAEFLAQRDYIHIRNHPEDTPEYNAWRPFIALELLGPNPFQPVTFSPDWRTSNTVALAEAMYSSRNFDAMPILGDALEEAGCDNDEMLRHCRGPGPHVRGCWVVDLLLGKE